MVDLGTYQFKDLNTEEITPKNHLQMLKLKNYMSQNMSILPLNYYVYLWISLFISNHNLFHIFNFHLQGLPYISVTKGLDKRVARLRVDIDDTVVYA